MQRLETPGSPQSVRQNNTSNLQGAHSGVAAAAVATAARRVLGSSLSNMVFYPIVNVSRVHFARASIAIVGEKVVASRLSAQLVSANVSSVAWWWVAAQHFRCGR